MFFRAANGWGRARTSSRARLYSTTSRIFPPVVTLTSSSSAGSDGDGASTLTYLSMSDDAAASGARAPSGEFVGEFVHARRGENILAR